MLAGTLCRRLVARPTITRSIMPLRARIAHNALHQDAPPSSPDASTSSPDASTSSTDAPPSSPDASPSSPDAPPGSKPVDDPHDVQFGARFGLRTITLNRPKKLNSLDSSMCRKIMPRLREWSLSQMANVVVIKGEGRAFCAGGDVASLAKWNRDGEKKRSVAFFKREYQLDHYIATYTKPYVAFMDGITMGGGVGLSIHAPFRIATENTVFAMPETTIGFFPDVGASYFLPKLDGQLGMYLALTSAQLKGVAAFYAGVATHYLHSASLPDLETRLAELQFHDYDDIDHRLRLVNSTIDEFCTGLPHDQPLAEPVAGDIRTAIDYAFHPSRTALEDCLDALEKLSKLEPSPGQLPVIDWARATRATILQRSPTSVKVTFHQLRHSARWSIAETFLREHVMAIRFMGHPDFTEGVTALLIDKPRRAPVWTPPTLKAVSPDAIRSFFPPPSELRTAWLERPDGSTDPAAPSDAVLADIGLPRESRIDHVVRDLGPTATTDDIVQHFLRGRQGTQGVREKVEEYLRRMRAEERRKEERRKQERPDAE